jgi:acetyl-CoA synthetase
VKQPNAGGYLVIRKPWPSLARTLWQDNARYLSTYWEKFGNRYYVAGDGASSRRRRLLLDRSAASMTY